MDLYIAIFQGIIIASTPLVLAAVGELVVEKSGVLNLGVEGMMIIGGCIYKEPENNNIPIRQK